jgi:hypothetical protein
VGGGRNLVDAAARDLLWPAKVLLNVPFIRRPTGRALDVLIIGLDGTLESSTPRRPASYGLDCSREQQWKVKDEAN